MDKVTRGCSSWRKRVRESGAIGSKSQITQKMYYADIGKLTLLKIIILLWREICENVLEIAIKQCNLQQEITKVGKKC